MGRVILVPPTIEFAKAIPNYGGIFTGSTRRIPITVMSPTHMMSEEFVTKNELSASLGMMLSTDVPEPNSELYREDPLLRFTGYYNLGRLERSKRKKDTGSFLGWSIAARQIGHTFWDHHELDELVEPLKGDLLLQICEDSWHFHGTHADDSAAIPQIFYRTKKYRFDVRRNNSDFKDELHTWLVHHTSDFDFDTSMTFVIYIRDAAEAAHFKLKWGCDYVIGPIGTS